MEEGNVIKLDKNGVWKGRLVIKKAGYKPIVKCVYGLTYEECEQHLIGLKIDNGIIDKSLFLPNMLFRDWVEIWYMYTSCNRRNVTATGYEIILRNYILPALGLYPINKITTGMLERLYANLLKNGRERLRELYGAGLTVNMVRTIHRVIVAIFNAALERSFIEKNPATKAKIPRYHTAAKKIYSQEELKTILKAAKERGIYELILFSLCTGMERGEICALRWKDISFNGRKVVITHSLRYEHQEYCLEPVRKISQRRQIILSPQLLSIMKSYKKTSNSNWVFPCVYKGGNKPRNPDILTVLFKKLLKSCGEMEGSFQSLRDTCAVMYLDSGMDLRSLTSLLGFENVRTVKRAFVPYMTSKKIVAADRMEGAMASIKSLYN